jgi:pimeloyl-ACP methyl ester carboxylesterase
MPLFERAGVSLYYEELGSGYPLLLFAPGGMRSSIEFWHRSPFDPTTEFANDLRVIAMDQRNAGHSRAPISAEDSWHTYSRDHLTLLDHLGIQRCHIMGGCIGSSYCLKLSETAPDRVSAAILQNPIGLHENRDAFREMFDGWSKELTRERSDLGDAAFAAFATFRENMYGGDFVFSVSRDFVRSCATPLMVLAGSDLYHPTPISQELARLAPNAELVETTWKAPEVVPETVKRVRAFLRKNQG